MTAAHTWSAVKELLVKLRGENISVLDVTKFDAVLEFMPEIVHQYQDCPQLIHNPKFACACMQQ